MVVSKKISGVRIDILITKEVGFESIINIRPRQQNMTMGVRDLQLKARIEKIVRYLLEVM